MRARPTTDRCCTSEQIGTRSPRSRWHQHRFSAEKLRFIKDHSDDDADVDGAHIRTLLDLFSRQMREKMIDRGYSISRKPPLYRDARQIRAVSEERCARWRTT